MRLPARSPTVADALFPAWQKDTLLARLAYDAVLILGFTGLVILSAQIAIRLPWTTVPITGSTFGVLVAGGALGAWRGAGSLTLYMLLGIMGAPVFAPGGAATTGSWDVHFIGPWSGSSGLPWDLSSGGYIVGFIFAAALVGYLSRAPMGPQGLDPWGNVPGQRDPVHPRYTVAGLPHPHRLDPSPGRTAAGRADRAAPAPGTRLLREGYTPSSLGT